MPPDPAELPIGGIEMNHAQQWQRLLDGSRLEGDRIQKAGREGTRSRFVRDYDRILFSDAFRRLNDKTQVFPLSEDDHVHTRLTHSLEVASVGRSLGIEAGRFLASRNLLPAGLGDRDVGDIVSSASLAHDIGNPPFGHSGEDAISEWFLKRSAEELGINQDQYLELSQFEGNALGYRTLVRHQRPGGLRLCCATLAAFTKYPCTAAFENSEQTGVQHKKYGFLGDDVASYEVVAAQCGLRQLEEHVWVRHPLAYLVEAADDICYSIIDLEDGFRLGLVTLEEVRELLTPLASAREPFEKYEATYEREAGDSGRGLVSALRAYSIGALIASCAQAFEDNHDRILAGEMGSSLLDATRLKEDVGRILEFVIPRCYRDSSVVAIERAGFEVLGGLLDIFYEALAENPPKSGLKTRQVFPNLERIAQAEESPYGKLIQLVEFVGGMTDRFAVETYRSLRGIELPGRVR